MAFQAIPLITSLAGDKGGAGNTGQAQSSPHSGGGGRGLIEPLVRGIKDKKWFEKQEKAKEEAARQQYAEGVFNYERGKDRSDLAEDVALGNYGEMTGDYISGDMITGPGAERFGGGLETLSGMSQGYNPGMSHNPFIGQYGTSVDSVNALRDSAQSYTDEHIGAWEEGLEGIGDDYEAARDKLRGDIDTRKDDFTTLIADDREARGEDEANMMLEQWAGSGSKKERAEKASRIERYRDMGRSPSDILATLERDEDLGDAGKYSPEFSHGMQGYE